jgi:murein DD-endopeptidase MepM/ murein hydrolase activator NlpD
MNLSCRLPIFTAIIYLITATIGVQCRPTLAQTQAPTKNSCPPPVLSRLTRYKIAAGETLESIAKRYKLIPETLIAFNPILKARSLPVGQEILIPPLNGMRVQVPAGSRWEDVAATYGVRADVLYELNGCQPKPRQVFIPGVNSSATRRRSGENYTGFQGYPLPITSSVALSYGWHPDAKTGQRRFHSGIDLLANPGTPVLSVDVGTIGYAGKQGGYGNLVVVNHQGGRQTRYAHLNQVSVRTGQSVKVGDKLGTVGTTGRPDTTKPHLHFEVRYYSSQGWIAQDPEPNLKTKPTAQR